MGQLPLEGFILTGGNSLTNYGGIAPERDEVEFFLLKHALANSIPLIGVCRGMQVIQHYFDISLYPVEGHVQSQQVILVEDGFRVVNSYHNLGTRENIEPLEVLARSEDGMVKAIRLDNLLPYR